MSSIISNGIIFVGNTGVGKSFICNKIFEMCGSSTRFESANSTRSVTLEQQTGQINYNNKTYNIIDTPGFFDTDKQANDGINVCKLVKALEVCQDIYALVFVFTDRFSTPHKIWFDRMCQYVTRSNLGHIILLHNKQNGYNFEDFTTNRVEINSAFGQQTNVEYKWIKFDPDNEQIKNLLNDLVEKVPFKLNNLVIPEICYEKEEKGHPYEVVVSENTTDQGYMKDVVKDTSHYETRMVWNRGKGNIFGELGLRGMPGAKREELVWVPSQTVEQIWVPSMVLWRHIKTYQDTFKVRFDGSKDLHDRVEVGYRVEISV